jgi:hypothetical protein
MQRLRWFGVDELDLTFVLPLPPPARAALQAADDHVNRPLGVLERTVRVACLRWGRQVALLAAILRRVVVTLPAVASLVVLAATSVIAVVVSVATSG